jgi:hypothetical protein
MAVAARRIDLLVCEDQIELADIYRELEDVSVRAFASYSADRLTTITMTLAVDDVRLERLRDRLGSKVIDWSEQPALLYRATELDHAPLFWVTTRVLISDNADVRRDGQLDLIAGCPRCGTGSAEITALVLPESAVPANTSLFTTHAGDTLISDALAQHLRPYIGTSARLTRALRLPDRVPLPWWQIMPLVTLPPMSPESRGMIRHAVGLRQPCPVCRRDGYFWSGEPVEIRYDAQALDPANLPDIAVSWERLGYGNIDQPMEDMHLAPGPLIVSQRVRRVIVAHDSPEIELHPIFIVGPV